MVVVIFNTLNLWFMFYFFMMATMTISQHHTIKRISNKGKKKGDENYIEDWNIHLIGGFFAYLVFFFSRSFYYKVFLGWSLV